MADLGKQGPQGSGFGRFMRELIDRVGTSNRGYNYRYGTWDRKGVRQGLIQTAAGTLVPGGSTLAGLALNIYNRAGMNNMRGNVPDPNLTKPTSGMWYGGRSPMPGPTGQPSYGAGAFGGGIANAQMPAPQTGGQMPVSLVPLAPEGNFRTTSPTITTNGMNLNAFSGRPIGFSSGYTPFGAGVISGEAARGMWGGMQNASAGKFNAFNRTY